MIADIQKIEAAARMSMGYHEVLPDALPENGPTSVNATTYWFAGLLVAAALAVALI